MLAGLLLMGSAPAGSAQVYNSADFVRSLYQRYLNREPSSNELTQWVWAFQKGTTLTDAQVTFLSSDDYFVRQGRDPKKFVTALYGEVLNRAPSQSEVTAWVTSLNSNRGNREKLVRDFLKAAQQEAVQRSPLPPSNAPARPVQAREGQLSATARLLGDSLENELGGTQQGQQLAIVSRNLVSASRNLEQTLSGTPNTTAYNQAYRDVHQTLSALEDAFQSVYFSAPNSSAYLDRFTRIFESLEGTPPQIVPAPTAPPSRPAGPGARTGYGCRSVQRDLALEYGVVGRYSAAAVCVAEHVQFGRVPQAIAARRRVLLLAGGLRCSMRCAWEHAVADVRTYVLRLRSLAGGISHAMRVQHPGRRYPAAVGRRQLGSAAGWRAGRRLGGAHD